MAPSRESNSPCRIVSLQHVHQSVSICPFSVHTLSHCSQLPIQGSWVFFSSFLDHFKAVSESWRVFQDVLKWQYRTKAAEFAPGFRYIAVSRFTFLKSERILCQALNVTDRQRSHVLQVHPVASSVASDRCECWSKSGLSLHLAWQLPPWF